MFPKGFTSFPGSYIELLKDVNDFFRIVREEANKSPEIKGEGLVVLVAGLPIGVPGGTNMLRVMPV